MLSCMAACSLGIRALYRLPDFQHGGGLHDFLDAGRIVDTGQLHQNLIVAQAVFLNDRLGNAQLVNAVADGLDRLLTAFFRVAVATDAFIVNDQAFWAPEVKSYSGSLSVMM